jgi:single-strand DNA-binding protein
MYLNKAMVIGNLTRDPELRAIPSGQQVCSFSVATNRVYKDKDGQQQKATEFHNIVVWGRQAETCGQYLKKGQSVLVEGRLQTRSWEGQDGKKNYKTEIVADRVQFGPKSSGNLQPTADSPADARGGNRQPQEEPSARDSGAGIEYPKEEINAEDIPF